MGIPARRNLLLGLVAVFLAQSWLVYTDPEGRRGPALSPLARQGQDVWLERNCQSCHQLYGFGGFLGPDLTNAAPLLTVARLDQILTEGAGLMPAYQLTADERAGVAAFLAAIDKTGTGQVRVPDIRPPRELLDVLLGATASADDPLSAAEQRGRAILLEQNCIDCHLPNASSTFAAGDLTRVSQALTREAIAQTLANGVPGKAMPRFALPQQDVEALLAVLARLGRFGESIRSGFVSADRDVDQALLDLPWFEYP